MQGISIFDFADYKSYLNRLIREKDERGYKSKIARALKCDLAYVSRILNGSAHFSLEQADALNSFLSHSSHESLFFLSLVSKERAGTASLKNHFEEQLENQRKQRLIIQNRIQPTKTLTSANQAKYYSSWLYPAIHLMLAIPNFQTADAIQNRLRIGSKKTHEILEFLVQIGLATQEKKRFVISSQSIHLGLDSPLIAQHHRNWRLKAIEALEHPHPSDTHYSSVVSLSKKDVPRVKEILIQAIESIRKIVRESQDEVVWCYDLDWFPVAE